MTATTHDEPNYMGVFWWLLVLTVLELGVIYTPVHRLAILALLVVLAISKAALVALYFMHLKFIRRDLGVLAASAVVLCFLVVLMIAIDIYLYEYQYQSFLRSIRR